MAQTLLVDWEEISLQYRATLSAKIRLNAESVGFMGHQGIRKKWQCLLFRNENV